jgi:hypothetical protein
MTHSIGAFTFVTLAGDPSPLKQQTLVLARPGVDGVAVWLLGTRGEKFTLRSAVDAGSFSDARGLFTQYKALIGGDPVKLVWNGLKMEDETFAVIVLDVRPVSIRRILGGVGGLNAPSQGWCECDWDLVAVEQAPAEDP